MGEVALLAGRTEHTVLSRVVFSLARLSLPHMLLRSPPLAELAADGVSTACHNRQADRQTGKVSLRHRRKCYSAYRDTKIARFTRPNAS